MHLTVDHLKGRPISLESIQQAHVEALPLLEEKIQANEKAQRKINQVICSLIGNIYQFDYQTNGLSKNKDNLAAASYIDNKNQLNCVFYLNNEIDHELEVMDNLQTRIKNKMRVWIPEEDTFTMKQLRDAGIFTFDCPDQMKVNVQLFCSDGYRCNNMRIM
jgi:hypothetical protein